MSKIVLFVYGTIPGLHLPVTGGGLRAWGLGEGLRSAGHDVVYSLPVEAIKDPGAVKPEIREHTFAGNDFDDVIRKSGADLAVVCNWGIANNLDNPGVPVVIDLHGPMMIEYIYREAGLVEDAVLSKVSALAKGDFFTCAGKRQKHYFLTWLIQSGVDITQNVITDIPLSLSPEIPEKEPATGIDFVYAGVPWPWQDSTRQVRCLLEEIAGKANCGLRMFTGKFPLSGNKDDKYSDLLKIMEGREDVKMEGMIPHDKMLGEYRKCAVAFDLMSTNYERELAFSTRTVEYLWAGLPVIHSCYSELGDYIRDYDAGWVLDPEDFGSLRRIIEEICSDQAEVHRKGLNAGRLVKENFTWDKTITPLAEFCNNPVTRKKVDTVWLKNEARLQEAYSNINNMNGHISSLKEELTMVMTERDTFRDSLENIRSKPVFKLYKAIKGVFKK